MSSNRRARGAATADGLERTQTPDRKHVAKKQNVAAVDVASSAVARKETHTALPNTTTTSTFSDGVTAVKSTASVLGAAGETHTAPSMTATTSNTPDDETAVDCAASKTGTHGEMRTPSLVPTADPSASSEHDTYMSTYVNCHDEIATEPLTSDDIHRLCTLGDAGMICNVSPEATRLRVCYDTLTHGYAAYLLTPAGARLFAFIKHDPLQKYILELLAGFALTETERLERKYGSFMHPWYEGGNKPPVRLDQLEMKMAELVRLLAKLGKSYTKYTFLDRYETWQKDVQKVKAEAGFPSMAKAKSAAIAGGPPMAGVPTTITVR
ncbi:hypothetical protein LTR36_001877 [Oleoguttula mirabilis]|uniref:Longin domain-containing protein n=1 Tax=Oleoguttula mirabilis TaxID=1507867 RepID=A0AAV9JMR6_9PEZI|nr:hypothetical protein LTR36_001877 [Oleoguttula mirabilis]